MVIKSLYPIMMTEKVDETVKFYEDTFGFKKKHELVTALGSKAIVLEGVGGNQVEVMEVIPGKTPPNFKVGMYGFRMNVDDIDAAYKELQEKGVKFTKTPAPIKVGYNLLCVDENGVNLTICQHVK